MNNKYVPDLPTSTVAGLVAQVREITLQAMKAANSIARQEQKLVELREAKKTLMAEIERRAGEQ